MRMRIHSLNMVSCVGLFLFCCIVSLLTIVVERSYGLSDDGAASYLNGAITGLWRTGEDSRGNQLGQVNNPVSEGTKPVLDPHWNFVGLMNPVSGSADNCQSDAQTTLNANNGSVPAVVTGAPIYNFSNVQNSTKSWVSYNSGPDSVNVNTYQPSNWISAVSVNGQHQLTGKTKTGAACSDPSDPDNSVQNASKNWSRWIYETTFFIDASKVNPTTVSLKLYGAVDNYLQVCVNGIDANVDINKGGSKCQPELHEFDQNFSKSKIDSMGTINAGSFKAGKNTMYFVVRSGYPNQGLIITGYDVSTGGTILTPYVGLKESVLAYGQTASLSPSVKNSGALTTSGVTWKLQRVIVDKGNALIRESSYDNDGSQTPEQYLGSFGGTGQSTLDEKTQQVFPWNPAKTSLGNYNDKAAQLVDVGKYICYMLSVSPYSSTTAGWRSSIECAVIGTQPYFQVIGGDIISGGTINAYNQNGLSTDGITTGAYYAGAGTNLAAIVGGSATNFVTGIGLNTGVSTKNGAGLGFANVSLGSNETAKGFVPLPATPTVDLSGTHTNWAGVANLSTCTTKCVYDVASGTIISGTVSPGADITFYVASGDVYLGNITYTYTSLDNIPRLNVYAASGNIIVLKDTTEIHGVFIAAGSDTKGRFYSCGIGATAVTYQSPAADIGQCSNSLTVYGAVVANKLILARTSGNYISTGAAGAPAEQFVFSPEVWLHTTASGGGTSSSTSAPKFDQYISLPPVL